MNKKELKQGKVIKEEQEKNSKLREKKL